MTSLLRLFRLGMPTQLLNALKAVAEPQQLTGLRSPATPSRLPCSVRTLSVSVSPPVKPLDVFTEPTLQRYLKLSQSHTRRPHKCEAVAQGVEFLKTRDQLSPAHLEQDLSHLTDTFLENHHCMSLEELCAWCDICRRLDYTGSQDNRKDMAEAVRGAIEGRVQELEPDQLASVAWLLASTHTQFPKTMEEEIVRVLTNQCRDASAEDLACMTDTATWLALGARTGLVAALATAAGACLKWCRPALAVRLAGAGVFASLPSDAKERLALVNSLANHMCEREGEYRRDRQSLQRALHLVAQLAAGSSSDQESVMSVHQVFSARDTQGSVCEPTPARRTFDASRAMAHQQVAAA